MVAPSDGDGSRARDKLRRAFRVPSPEPAPKATPPLVDALASGGGMRAFLQRRREQLAGGGAAEAARPRARTALPDAVVRDTPHGPLWCRELRYPVAHRHGDVPLAAGRTFEPSCLASPKKPAVLNGLLPEHCLFLDTETTGLSGGAGTIVFAYGLAFFEGDELVLEQLFLRDFTEEPAMLHHVAARLARHPVPVTFVGKSYDRHRIAARLAVHRLEAPVLTERHVDLYHVVRRRYAAAWPDCRLRTAEARLLGLSRHDDLPGSEAPAAFLDWIRDGTGPVDRVLEHNRLDVLSLVALLGVLGTAS